MRIAQAQPQLFSQDAVPVSGINAPPLPIWNEEDLVALAFALGAADVPGLSPAERALGADSHSVPDSVVTACRVQILGGEDPLGDTFCALRSSSERRERGATYTPKRIVHYMVQSAAKAGCPARVVEPGAGSARFLTAAGKRFPEAELVGVEIDPVAAVLARANAAVLGMAARTRIILEDFRDADLGSTAGRTLFIGNPPYVRHHQLEPDLKQWLTRQAQLKQLSVSQLAGLHVYFYLATVLKARSGDWGTFITAAEWMDVNYGQLLRELFVGELGGQSIVVVEPTAQPFPDAAATAAITRFEIASEPALISLQRVSDLGQLGTEDGIHNVRRERLALERRWSHLTRPTRDGPEGYIELGEICRVHRGAVTGFNKAWIAGPHSVDLPEAVLFASVTRARELFDAGMVLDDSSRLRNVIDLPVDLDEFCAADKRAVERFLLRVKRMGADQGYVATNRKAWWSVGLRNPAPILATYMARRPPTFVRNVAEARHINIAHGLYPREPLSDRALRNLASFLSRTTTQAEGRTYSGGLTKFEPREMERLLVPTPGMLEQEWV